LHAFDLCANHDSSEEIFLVALLAQVMHLTSQPQKFFLRQVVLAFSLVAVAAVLSFTRLISLQFSAFQQDNVKFFIFFVVVAAVDL
jgi:hypothetical protein